MVEIQISVKGFQDPTITRTTTGHAANTLTSTDTSTIPSHHHKPSPSTTHGQSSDSTSVQATSTSATGTSTSNDPKPSSGTPTSKAPGGPASLSTPATVAWISTALGSSSEAVPLKTPTGPDPAISSSSSTLDPTPSQWTTSGFPTATPSISTSAIDSPQAQSQSVSTSSPADPAPGATLAPDSTPSTAGISQASSEQRGSTKLGLGLGIGLAIPILIAGLLIIFLMWRRHRKNSAARYAPASSMEQLSSHSTEAFGAQSSFLQGLPTISEPDNHAFGPLLSANDPSYSLLVAPVANASSADGHEDESSTLRPESYQPSLEPPPGDGRVSNRRSEPLSLRTNATLSHMSGYHEEEEDGEPVSPVSPIGESRKGSLRFSRNT